MKTKLVFTTVLASFLFFMGCSGNDDIVQESELDSQGLSVSENPIESENSIEYEGSTTTKSSSSITRTYDKEQQEVIETFIAIAQSIKDGDIDKLISFHAYGPKFTEFKNGSKRNGGAENEEHERTVFGAVTEVVKFDALDLQVAVYYGKVANVTFHSDFQLKFGSEEIVTINDQITLLFVQTKEGWKMVHEHHSPLTNKLL